MEYVFLLFAAALSAQVQFFKLYAGTLHAIQKDTAAIVDIITIALLPVVALAFGEIVRKASKIIYGGLCHISERGAHVEATLKLGYGLLTRSYIKQQVNAALWPPLLIESLVHISYIIITVVWSIIFVLPISIWFFSFI